jgi:hypothetical protein
LADYQQGYAYCSPFLSVRSLDAHLAWPDSPVFDIATTEEDPHAALERAQDLAFLNRWVRSRPAGQRQLAEALMRGESQVEVARREGVTEAAISKRMKALIKAGGCDLARLRRSILLH